MLAVPSDSSGGGHSMSDPNSQDLLSDPPFSATLRAPFLFRDRWLIPGYTHAGVLDCYTKVSTEAMEK